MVSSINSLSPVMLYEVGIPPDEKSAISGNEENTAVPNVSSNTDKVEISNEAHTASINTQIVKIKQPTREFMEVFSTNIWSLGLEAQK